MSRAIQVVGLDPSLRNWGIAKATLHLNSTQTPVIEVTQLEVLQPVLSTNKQVRNNSQDLDRAKQLCEGTVKAIQDAQAIFVEVPVGSQSARSMASYGICVGILGALRAMDMPFFEVSPSEVKMASFGKKTATKKEMIDWAIQQHPDANWPTHVKNGLTLVTASSAEHMADAIAAIYAGVASTSFQQLLPFLQGSAITKETYEN